MAGSQRTYAARTERFSNGVELIQTWSDYNVSNTLIQKTHLPPFVEAVEAANTAVGTRLTALNDLRNGRRAICFTKKDTNPDCAERRIEQIISYLSSEIGAQDAATVNMKAILKKIQPRYKGEASFVTVDLDARETRSVKNALDGGTIKNTGTVTIAYRDSGIDEPINLNAGEQAIINTPTGTLIILNKDAHKRAKVSLEIHTDKNVSKSPSEKSFASLVGNLDDVIERITELSAGGGVFVYNPTDNPNITVSNMEALRAQLKQFNKDIQKALDAYGNTNRERKLLFDGPQGMDKRITMIKSYLGGLTGGKKNNHYIEFVDAIEGV